MAPKKLQRGPLQRKSKGRRGASNTHQGSLRKVLLSVGCLTLLFNVMIYSRNLMPFLTDHGEVRFKMLSNETEYDNNKPVTATAEPKIAGYKDQIFPNEHRAEESKRRAKVLAETLEELKTMRKELQTLRESTRTPAVPVTTTKTGDIPITKASSGKLIIKPVPKENCQPAWTTPRENTPEELKKIWDVTIPFCNETAAAVYTMKMGTGGLRNQIMTFSAIVMAALKGGHKQILLETLTHKDVFGSNRQNPHEALFDVAHWNSYYPLLPRMVHCDPTIMMDYSCNQDGSYFGKFDKIPEHDMPHQIKDFGNNFFGIYQRYTRGRGPFADPVFPNPADVLIKSGALRPHPDLIAIQEDLLDKLNAPKGDYMALHPRVEPDMQRHPVCVDKKVYNLTNIVQFLQAEWKEPPVKAVYVTINREFLEREGILDNYKEGQTINWIAVNNLRELNRIRKEGLWSGRVTVFELGSNALQGTKYAERMWSIGGSILGFETATTAKIFVGTEISSFSSDIVSSRFYRGKLDNYYYQPNGLHRVTDKSNDVPPAFVC